MLAGRVKRLALAGLLLWPVLGRAEEPAWAQVETLLWLVQAVPPEPLAQAPAQGQGTSGVPAASGAAAVGVGQVTHLSGTLMAKRADGTVKVLAVKSDVIEGDTLATQDGTYARLKFNDGAEVVLRPTSQLKVDAYQFAEAEPKRDNVVLSLLRGGLRKVTGLIGRRNRDNVRLAAPTATIGIRGTHLGMLFCHNDCGMIRMPGGVPPQNGLHLDVAAGAVTLTNQAGTQLVNAGQFAFAPLDPKLPPVIVPAGQGIQVTIPPAIARNDATGRTLGANRNDDGCAIE